MKIARRTANTVPEVTVSFWIIEVLATTVGEIAADLLSMNLMAGPDLVLGRLRAHPPTRPAQRRVTRGNDEIPVTPRKFALLERS